MARKRKKSHAVLSAIAQFCRTLGYVLFIIGVSLLISTLVIITANDALALVKQDKDVTLTLTSDKTAEEMAELLQGKGIINYKQVFLLFLKVKKMDSFDKGTFDLNSNMDYGQIVSTLKREKKGSIVRVTIPEGYTIKQIAQLMEDQQVCSSEAFLITANTYDFSHTVLKDVPMTENRLEGYLFPDTYDFYVNENTVSVINKMLNNFEKRYTKAMRELTEKNGKTIAEIVVVASLIEREAQLASERATIAGVIYNRLADKANFPKLQIDAALMYVTGHKEALTAEDLLIDSPYNTYLNEGLPPTAICNPGLPSILAAIDPEAHEYYYYVADPETGAHVFSKTLAEHNAAVAKMNKKSK